MPRFTPRSGNCLILPFLFFSLVAISQAQPTAQVSSNAPLCLGAPILELFETGGSAINWNWSGPNGFASTAQNPSIPNPPLAAAGLYRVTISDATDATATAAITVAIHQPTPLSCNDNVIISLNGQGLAFIIPQTVLEGNYDYDFYTVEIFDNQGQSLGDTLDCALIGQNLVFKVNDICNNNACWGTIKVEDKLAPILPCEDIFFSCAADLYSPEYLQNELGIAQGIPDASDNCGNFSLSYVDEFHDLPCELPNGITSSSAFNIRYWQAVDAAGNQSSCSQRIYFVRRHLADVHFPNDTVISCQNPSADPSHTGAPYIVEFGHDYLLYPNNAFCEMDAGFTDDTIIICDGTKKILRNWTVLEDCPESGATEFLVFEQLIKIEDIKGPVFTCPPNDTVSIDPFTCCATIDLPDVLISDYCSRLNKLNAVIQTYDIWTNDSSTTYGINGALENFPDNNLWDPDTLGQFGQSPCLQQGSHTVSYVAIDDCGNQSTCSFSLVVKDKIPPVVSCDSYTKVGLGIDGFAEIAAATFNDGSYDDCCATIFYARRMDSPDSIDFSPSVWFNCSDIGDTLLVIFRAYDCAGNFGDCMVRVLVEDKIRPVCEAPSNLTIDCAGFDQTLASFGFATAHDNCCLDTILATVNFNLFDTVCNRGTLVRTFKAFDCAGNSSQCTQKVTVDYTQYYFLKLPDDKIINACNGTGDFGEPAIHFEDCELIGISYKDEVFTIVPEGCYRIDRHWKIINWCTYDPNGTCIQIPNPDISQVRPYVLPGPVISPPNTLPPWNPTITMVNPTDSFFTNYSIFWEQNANCYEYKQMILVFDTMDPVIENCPTGPVQICDQTSNNAALWNSPKWYDPGTSSHDLCEGPADLSITATDACTMADIRFRYLLFLDLDQNGSLETVINSKNPPPPGMVYFNNALNPNFSGGELLAFDLRPVPASEKYNFSLHETISGNKRTAVIQWKTAAQLPHTGNSFGQPGIPPELPYGHHKIQWLVEDGCTNETFCEYDLDVKDCKPPTVVCLNGLSVNIPASSSLELWTSDFLQYTNDNCTPSPQLQLSIRKSGTGAGFPVDAAGNPVTSISFDCSEIGSQPVELWAIDLAGNADYCETIIVVQDKLGVCGISGNVSGTLITEDQVSIADADVTISGSSTFAPAFTYFSQSANNGQYLFGAIPIPSDFILSPDKDDNPLNGVSTYDLVEISKHILGIKPLGSPYKMIAADANHSNSITSFDIIELRKLILGIYSELPANTSWRFVEKAYVFPNPFNPFAAPFPESIAVVDLPGSQTNQDFVGVKIGDVNNSVVANFGAISDNRNKPESWQPAYFTVSSGGKDYLKVGESVEIKIQAAETLIGYQFTLNFNSLVIESLTPAEDMQPDNYAIFPEKNALTVACEKANQTAFTLKCKATHAGYLNQMLVLDGQITPAEAYGQDGTFKAPSLQFPSPNSFEVYAARPNPFANKTNISVYMPHAGDATLQISDENGRGILVQKRYFDRGYNTFEIDLQGYPTNEVLYYNIESATGTGAGKMIRSH